MASHLIVIASAFYPSVGFADTSPAWGGFSQVARKTLPWQGCWHAA
ncbi:MAG: hypothetical protein II752_07810 [Muribaculaceae bacterium]|nr:hypothetical protein [Muribaculaceae bacterium]